MTTYIKLLDKKLLLGDTWPVENDCFVELWDFSRANESEDSRIEAVTTVAAECWGSAPKDRRKLYDRLLTESLGLPSSAFEFVRIGDNSINESLRNGTWPKPWTDALKERLPSKQTRESCLNTLISINKENVATFRIRVPIFIIRQIVRHRSFSYQELSRRVPIKDQIVIWGVKGLSVNKIPFVACIEDAYSSLLRETGRPEIARTVLPVGTLSNLWIQGDAKAWSAYFKLRLDKHAQPEHQAVASAMAFLLEKHQPLLHEKACKVVI